MINLQFWHSSSIFKDSTINTFYLAETKLWLFMASDINKVIDKINENKVTHNHLKYVATKPISKQQIRIFKNNKWEIIDVLCKEEILKAIESCVFAEAKEFEIWVRDLCNSVPEGCILSTDSKEYEFLNRATNRFMDLFEEINNSSFMSNSPEIRLYKLKDLFGVYTELLSYQPIKDHIDFIEKTRPSMESVISSELIKFIRNTLVHFPFFTTWDEIYISKQLINWNSEGRSIDRFLKKYQGHEDVLYRFQERISGNWRYPTIKFPQTYNDDKIYLKDMITEEDGVLLCAVLMYNVVSSQIIHQD